MANDYQTERAGRTRRPPALKQLAQTKLNKAFLVRRELKKLPEMLGEVKHVLNLARGEYDGREGLIAVTEHRILFLDQGMVRHGFEDFRFDKITSVQQSTGVLSGELTIFSAGTKHQIKDVHPKRRAVEIADYVRSQLGKTSPPSGSARAPSEASG
jgi:Bacterial PH domain